MMIIKFKYFVMQYDKFVIKYNAVLLILTMLNKNYKNAVSVYNIIIKLNSIDSVSFIRNIQIC